MKKILLVVSIVALVVPAAASAKGSGSPKNAAKQCKALRAEMGADAFRAAFAGKRGKSAFGRCVSAKRKERRDARKAARKACRAKGLRGRAMKRCFRQELAAAPAPKPAEYQDAVDECRAEQAEDPEGFADEFGDGSNAFGKCVAHEVSDDEGEDETGEDDGDESGEVEDDPGEVQDDPADDSPGDGPNEP
jgi:hypothetical protein